MEAFVEGVARWGGAEVTQPEGVPGALLYLPRGQFLLQREALPDMEALVRETAARGFALLRLGAWPEALYLEAKQWLETKGWREEGTPFDCYDLWQAPHEATAVALPAGYRRVQLRAEDAPHVNGHWELGQGSDTLPTVLECIARRPSAAVAAEATGEVVAWALTRHDSSVGAVTVLPEHRRRNLGSYCVAALVTELAGRTMVLIDPENEPSRTMHAKLGFVNTGKRFAWARFSRLDREAEAVAKNI